MMLLILRLRTLWRNLVRKARDVVLEIDIVVNLHNNVSQALLRSIVSALNWSYKDTVAKNNLFIERHYMLDQYV